MSTKERIDDEKLKELVQNLIKDLEDLKTRVTLMEKNLQKLRRGHKWV